MRAVLIFLLVAATALSSAADSGRLTINGRRSERSIRELLLKQTPIGSDAQAVATFLNERLRHEGGWVPSEGNGSLLALMATGKKKEGRFQYDLVPDLTPRFHEKWIGESLDVKIHIDSYLGFPLPVWVLATWRFSRDGLLRDILVEKEADGP